MGEWRTQLGQVVRGYAVNTLLHCHRELERDRIFHIEPVQLSMTELSQTRSYFVVPLTTRAAAFMTRSCLLVTALLHPATQP